MKKKFILIFMISIVTGVTACSLESKEDITSVESDSWLDADKDETAYVEIAEGDPIAGIVEKYEDNMITIKTPEDDMLYYFFTEKAQILEGFSTESAHTVEENFSIAVGDKVEISYRGTPDDEEHPTKAVKIVVITGE